MQFLLFVSAIRRVARTYKLRAQAAISLNVMLFDTISNMSWLVTHSPQSWAWLLIRIRLHISTYSSVKESFSAATQDCDHGQCRCDCRGTDRECNKMHQEAKTPQDLEQGQNEGATRCTKRQNKPPALERQRPTEASTRRTKRQKATRSGAQQV